MNQILKEIFATGSVTTPQGERIKIHSHILAGEGRFLQEIIQNLRAVVSLEVGLGFGVSALFICEALEKTPDTRHIVIDPYQFQNPKDESDWQGLGLFNLKRAGYEKIVEFHNLPSHAALPQLAAKATEIDIAFIDGWHTFDHTLVDFFYIDMMLRMGGVVVLHDAGFPSIRKVCRYILNNRAYSLVGYYIPKLDSYGSLIPSYLKDKLFKSNLVTWLVKSATRCGVSCLALKKEGVDTRPWHFHKKF